MIDYKEDAVKHPWERYAAKARNAKRRVTKEKWAQASCDDFNARHRIGTKVKYWPMARGNEPEKTGETRSIAYMQGGNAMIMCTGQAGGMALTHVEVLS